MTTQTYIVGTKIYYTGDQANIPGEGEITEVRIINHKVIYSVDLNDGRHWGITRSDFNSGVGQRFFLLEEHQRIQEERINSILAFTSKLREARESNEMHEQLI
jgi:hypothetical protein